MADIFIGEKVVKLNGDVGIITSLENDLIYVDFKNRVARFRVNAFEQGFLRYENEDLQKNIVVTTEEPKPINSLIQTQPSKAEEDGERRGDLRLELERKSTEYDIQFLSVSAILSPAPIFLGSVKKADKALVQEVFNECDKVTEELFQDFNPEMKYPKYTSRSRSKYCVGFLCKHLDTYVLRVFSRNDVYKKRVRTGITVMESYTTEIFRIIRTNNTVYHFSKNLAYSSGYFNNSVLYKQWHSTSMDFGVLLNKVIRKCDCAYLNDHIAEENIDCYQYTKLLFDALYDNKAEIVFKYKMFSSVYRIDNLAKYLEEFTPKQINFACQNDVINALPVIKKCSLVDVDILRKVEGMMRRGRWNLSVYDRLAGTLKELNIKCDDLYKRLVDFLKKIDYFDPSLYSDYIGLLRYCRDVTIRNFFDKNYIALHDRMLEARRNSQFVNKDVAVDYANIAKELSWIDREENGYFIILPKNIAEFGREGDMQHNCVFTLGYYLRVIKRQSIIVFLRKEKHESFITIEYEYGTFDVIQALGKYNKGIDEDLYKYVVDLGKRLQIEMLSHT